MSAMNKKRITQIGIMVRDIEKAAEEWARLLGVEKPKINITEGYEITHATYKGEPCKGRLAQAPFNLENIQIELVSPYGDEPSVWKDCLEKDGEGLHHIAFKTEDIEDSKTELEEMGMQFMQYGEWPVQPRNGCYTYMDGRDSVKTIIELLQV